MDRFFYMGGYGFYVWSAYGCVIAFLFAQWLRPWIRWHRYLRKLKLYSIKNDKES